MNVGLRHALAASAASGLCVSGTNAGAFNDVNLGAAGPAGLNFCVLVTGPTTFSASNSGTLFAGNAGLAAGASTNFSGGGTIAGALYKDFGATLQSNIASQMNLNGGIITQSLSQAVNDATSAWQAATMLAPDQTFGAVGSGALTIAPSGPLNGLGGRNTVVSVQSINITNPGNNLTLSGGANDWFIINVAGDITVSNGQIKATGGIPASHILFALGGNTSSVNLTNGSSLLTGTYLAPNATQQVNLTPGTVNGAVIAYKVHTSSGPTVTGGAWTAVPSPATACLIAVGAGLHAVRRRRPNG